MEAPKSNSKIKSFTNQSAAKRVDIFLAEQLPDVSRSSIQKYIAEGRVELLGNKIARKNQRIEMGESLKVTITPELGIMPNKEIKLEIIYENPDFVCIDKPAGVLTHPTNTDNHNTLVNALLAHFGSSDWTTSDRSGIVHRLDKDTSGLILVAKNQESFVGLQDLFRHRLISKTYTALAYGKPVEPRIDITTIQTRSKADPTKMKVVLTEDGKESSSQIREIQSYLLGVEPITLLEIKPKTGRMHQIRLHLSHLQMPVLGDDKYGSKTSKIASKKLGISRQMLHATRLHFDYKGESYRFVSALPVDMKSAISKLAQHDKK